MVMPLRNQFAVDPMQNTSTGMGQGAGGMPQTYGSGNWTQDQLNTGLRQAIGGGWNADQISKWTSENAVGADQVNAAYSSLGLKSPNASATTNIPSLPSLAMQAQLLAPSINVNTSDLSGLGKRAAGDYGYYGGKIKGYYDNPSTFEMNPAYQAMYSRGLDALNRTAAAKGQLGSGNRLYELQKYGSDLANQAWNTEMQNLSNLSGQSGQLANQALGQAGQLDLGAQTARANAIQNMMNTGVALSGQRSQEALQNRGYDIQDFYNRGQLNLGNRNADITRELGLGNLALGNRNADITQEYNKGNLALGNRNADITRELGLGNIALGQQANTTADKAAMNAALNNRINASSNYYGNLANLGLGRYGTDYNELAGLSGLGQARSNPATMAQLQQLINQPGVKDTYLGALLQKLFGGGTPTTSGPGPNMELMPTVVADGGGTGTPVTNPGTVPNLGIM